MHSWAPENVLWTAGTILDAVLLTVVLAKRQFRAFPIFSIWMVEMFTSSIGLYLIARGGTEHMYSVVYWLTADIEVLLQIAVAVEFAHKALCHQGRWVDGTQTAFWLSLSFAAILSISFSLWVQPVVQHRDLFYMRLGLLTSLLVFTVVVSTAVIVYHSGSVWPKDEMLRFGAFVVWAAASALDDTLHAYWRTAQHFATVELAHTATGEAVIIYWICLLLFPHKEVPLLAQADIDRLSFVFRHRS